MMHLHHLVVDDFAIDHPNNSIHVPADSDVVRQDDERKRARR
jgi:hypothetical protein